MTQDDSQTTGPSAAETPGRPSGAPKPSRSPGWMRWLLLASLALNLAVVGVVAGGLLRHGRPEHGGPPRGREFITPYTEAFSKDQRRELGRQLFSSFERKQGDRPRPAPFGDYRNALSLLRAEPFDSAAFSEALSAQDARAAERQKMGQQVLVEYVTALSPEARAAYADRLEAELDELAKRVPPRKPEG
ncbi:periplasmic heavy metal sensor [Yangia mangrovi]|uniref:Periplasmic heavy metal sensor n=1 Tax=Alloyangia mangrovi TaxID=1779329 RepID=A0ABT2KMW5_9RHOB|nr:periplasmic heavy metal sensor [Alloyangia mangrovi]MCA0939518.1 periplasmic heavy metal sensor [Alloyangia pacifica]MCA0943460.1 periplasmic heavy metal sensor [Alloyangia pacifica]MCT4370692.1 periplasmic heavy metal sensor [Alloyangia mangrovi]